MSIAIVLFTVSSIICLNAQNITTSAPQSRQDPLFVNKQLSNSSEMPFREQEEIQSPISQPHIPYRGPQSFSYSDEDSAEYQNFFESQKDTNITIEQFKPEKIPQINTKLQNISSDSSKQEQNGFQKPESNLKQHKSNKSADLVKNSSSQNNEPLNRTEKTSNQTLSKEEEKKSQFNKEAANPLVESMSNLTGQTSTQKDKQELISQISTLKQQNIKYEKSNNLMTGEKKELQNELLLIRKQNSQLKQDLDQAKIQIKQLQSQFEEKIKSLNSKYEYSVDSVKNLTTENLKLKAQGDNKSQSKSEVSKYMQSFEQQKTMLELEQKQLESISQTVNALKIQSEQNGKISQTAENSISSQQINSLSSKVGQIKVNLEEVLASEKQHQSKTFEQQSTLNQILGIVKNLQSSQSQMTIKASEKQSDEPPSPSDPKNVSGTHEATKIQKDERGYRVNFLIDWFTLQILAGATGFLIAVLISVKIYSRCRKNKKDKAEDQRQLKTPQSMDSRTSQEQFSDWQG